MLEDGGECEGRSACSDGVEGLRGGSFVCHLGQKSLRGRNQGKQRDGKNFIKKNVSIAGIRK